MCEGPMVILKIILALLKQNIQRPLFFNWNSEIGGRNTTEIQIETETQGGINNGQNEELGKNYFQRSRHH